MKTFLALLAGVAIGSRIPSLLPQPAPPPAPVAVAAAPDADPDPAPRTRYVVTHDPLGRAHVRALPPGVSDLQSRGGGDYRGEPTPVPRTLLDVRPRR